MRCGIFAATAAGSLLLSGALAGAPALAANAATSGPTITTIAGGIGGPGLATTIGVVPCAVAADGASVLASDGAVLRSVNESTDQLTNLAGVSDSGNVPGSSANGVPGLSTNFGGCAIAVDASGNVVSGSGNAARVLARHTGSYYGQNMTAGDVYQIAGNGTSGYTGDGGPALKAELDNVTSVAIDAAGNVILSDSGVSRIRVVAAKTGTYYGMAMTAGDIYTVYTGGTSSYLSGVAVDHHGNLIIADPGSQKLFVRATQTGNYYGTAMHVGGVYGIAPLKGFKYIDAAVTIDGSGNVVFADEATDLVQVVAASTGTFYGQSMTIGHVYTIAGNGSNGYNGDGIPALSASFLPQGVAVDSSGNVVIGNGSNGRLRVVATTTGTFYGQAMKAGYIYTVAGNGSQYLSGSGGPATQAELGVTGASVVDSSGNILFSDLLNSTGGLHVLAASTGTFYGIQMTKGNVYTLPNFGTAGSLSLDGNGNVLIGGGQLTVLAEKTGFFYDKYMMAGKTYQIPAAGPSLSAMTDQNGNVILGFPGPDSSGGIDVFPVKTGTFYGHKMTAYKMVKIAGNGQRGGSLGDGGPALNALIANPTDTIVDRSGNLVITDQEVNEVRVIAAKTGTFYGVAMKAGNIYKVAGGGTTLGDGGPAVNASLNFPTSVATDAAGNLVIDDMQNFRIRVIAVKTGTFYGQAMKANDIYTIAGNGARQYGGDGGAATTASLYFPNWVTVEKNGNILSSDSDRIRMITAG